MLQKWTKTSKPSLENPHKMEKTQELVTYPIFSSSLLPVPCFRPLKRDEFNSTSYTRKWHNPLFFHRKRTKSSWYTFLFPIDWLLPGDKKHLIQSVRNWYLWVPFSQNLAINIWKLGLTVLHVDGFRPLAELRRNFVMNGSLLEEIWILFDGISFNHVSNDSEDW